MEAEERIIIIKITIIAGVIAISIINRRKSLKIIDGSSIDKQK